MLVIGNDGAGKLFLFTEALFAALFGAWFPSERLGLIGALGCLLILLAILLVELGDYRRVPGTTA